MMGFGPFDHGSSSSSSLSSSTLSPLAPPFTVDRPAPKPAASPHLLKDQYDNWLHLHPPTSNSNSIPLPNPEIIPIGTGFGCFGPQPIVSSATHFPPLSKPVFSFGPPEFAKSSLLEAEPYYPHYPAAIPDKNASISEGFAFGVSNSGGPSSEACYESGYGENSSGFGHTAKGNGWWTEVGTSILPNCGNPTHLGGPAVEEFVVPEEASGVWHGKSLESSAKKAHIGSNCTGPKLPDATYTVFSQESASPFKMPASSVLAPSSVLQEESYSRIPDPESIKAWNPFKLNKTPYNKCFPQLDSCTTGPSNSCHAAKFSFNFSGPSLGTIASKNVLSRDQPAADAYNKNDTSAGCNFTSVNACGNEVNSDTSRTSNEMENNHHKFFGFPLAKTELPLDLKPVMSLRSPSKENSNSKATQFSVSKPFISAPDTAGPGDSIKISPEMPDQLLTAVDSPCWRGPPPPHQLSPFSVLQAPVYLPFMKESEGYSDFNKQNQFLPNNVNNVDSVTHKSHENLDFESGCEKKGSSSFNWNPTSVKFPYADYANKTGSDCFNFGKGIDIQSFVGMPDSKNESTSELETSGVKPFSPGKDVNCMENFKPESRGADSGIHLKKETQNISSDCVSSGASNVSSERSPRLDTQILIKMIHNLSELLLSGHHTDENSLKEDDYEVLQLVINNLNACVSNKVGLKGPMLASFPGLTSSWHFRNSTDPQEGSVPGMFSLTGKRSDNVLDQSCHQCVHNEENFHAWNKKYDKFDNGYSSDDIASDKDNEMTKAIEKAMKENSEDQGQEDHQSVLYKNLWIEAEGALCSMKYELRLAHMKIKLEKDKQRAVNSIGIATDSHCSLGTAVEKSSNGDSSRDNSRAMKLEESSKEEVITTQVGDITEGSFSNPKEAKQPSSSLGDMKSSVLARFKILQNRIENLSFNHEVVPTQQHDMIHDGERHGQVPTTWCLEKQLDLVMEHPPRKVVKPVWFEEKRTAWPFITDQLEDGSSEVMNGVYAENPGEQSDDDSGFCSDVRKQHEVNDSVLHVADETALQLLGNRLSLGGCDGTSSDWEHVLKEELTL